MNAARRALRGLPTSVPASGPMLAAARLPKEPGALRTLRRELHGVAAVIAAGGGQLDALFGGFFGQPYVLWRWGRTARAVNAPFLVLSVGTGTLSDASRRMCLRALRLATYRSYRDEGSRALLGAPALTAGDPIVPDLAYGLPVQVAAPRPQGRLVVGVSPMTFQHPDFYPHGSKQRYAAHVQAMATITTHLLDMGCKVRLFTTDTSDEVAVADVLEHLGHLDLDRRRLVEALPTRTLGALMATYADVDVVVTSRLHGALLAHLAQRPVFALAHERKVRVLMAEVGHSRFCQDIDDFSAGDTLNLLADFVSTREALAEEINIRVARMRERVEAQYDVLFGPCIEARDGGDQAESTWTAGSMP
jgi:polysaccharide pyruvyl transferase WcaK-like protein